MLAKQKCSICEKEHEVVMPSPQSRYVKICLDCYVKLDTKGQKDFGFPDIKRNTGTHHNK